MCNPAHPHRLQSVPMDATLKLVLSSWGLAFKSSHPAWDKQGGGTAMGHIPKQPQRVQLSL